MNTDFFENAKLTDNELEGVVGGRDWSALIEYLIAKAPNDPQLPFLIDDVRHYRIKSANERLIVIQMSHPELTEGIKKFK